jgi:cbb3-type cytochrome oxidase maturation protein
MDGMDILYLLVPLSVVLVFVIGVVFWWSLKSGQFEDLEGEGFRILMDDDKTAQPNGMQSTDTSIDSDQSRPQG